MLGAFERLAVAALAAVVVTALSGAVLLNPEPQRPTLVLRPDRPVTLTRNSAEARPVPAAAPAEAPGPIGELDLDAVAAGAPVPRLIPTMGRSGPAPAASASAPGDPHQAFVRDLLPLVLLANEEALADRARLWEIRVKRDLGRPLTALDRLWLSVVADRYGTGSDDFDELMRRIDAAPPSLVLAAAAAASDWGRAEAAKSRNALFGIALPANQPGGGRARAAAAGFDAPVDAVRAYLHVLNADPGLDTFRSERADLRRAGVPLGGAQLAPFVESTGAGGRLRALIETERLDRFDAARLDPADRSGDRLGTAGAGTAGAGTAGAGGGGSGSRAGLL